MPAVRSRGRTEEAKAKPRPDAYVGLLGLSLLALSVAILFAYLNWDLVSEKPKPVQTSPPGGARMAPTPGPGVAPGPGGPGAAPPGAQPGAAPVPGAPGGNPPPPTAPQKK